MHLHLVLAVLQEGCSRPLLFFTIAHMDPKQGAAGVQLLVQITGMAWRQPVGQERLRCRRIGGGSDKKIAEQPG